ncbi:hypothetical protein ACH5RR_025801 [Cinchona calisaya]|uniref:Uncharacterized protein n=1 Tax=Cinchona calisaya TaxID=153742 RepID=A0ABD2Z306_9GENT
MEAHRKALEARVEKLINEKTTLDEVNNKLLDKVLEERQRTHECRINWSTEYSKQERKIREQDMEIRELKRKLMEITEAEMNMELRLMNIELRIQELNDHLNPPVPALANDDEVKEDPEEVLDVDEEIEEEVDVEDN